jgi:hypothetical protein
MIQTERPKRRLLGLALVLAALVSLPLIQGHTRQLALERLDEFNRRDPDFAKRNFWITRTPAGQIGLQEIFPDRPNQSFFAGSAVVLFPEGRRNVRGGEIWEVADGKLRLLSSLNPVWIFRTNPVLAAVAVATLLAGGFLVLSCPDRQRAEQ